MSRPRSLYSQKLSPNLYAGLGVFARLPLKYWRKSFWHRIVVALILLILLVIGSMYGIARWYIYSEHNLPYTMGVSFIPAYASSLGLNPQQTMDALINDLHIKNFRLTSYWSEIEPQPNQYDFSQLDWQFAKADAAHAKIVLVVGLRQPRWPECHPPSWINMAAPTSQWQSQLEDYVTHVVNRYKGNPALASYQIENEYFLGGFGDCLNFSRQRLISETDLVRKLDPNHPIIITRSNNALGWPAGQPQPDKFSISIYKRTWNDPISNYFNEYLEYPFPAWYYAFLAGWQKIMTRHDMIIGEMQAEAWPPNDQTIPQTSLAQQNDSLDAKRLQDRFKYARATGMRTTYYWGAEYWYYRLTALHDPSLWRIAQQEFAQSDH